MEVWALFVLVRMALVELMAGRCRFSTRAGA